MVPSGILALRIPVSNLLGAELGAVDYRTVAVMSYCGTGMNTRSLGVPAVVQSWLYFTR